MAVSMGNSRSSRFVDQPPGSEAVERERRGERVRLSASESVGEHMARAWRRLEAAGAPAAIHEKAREPG